jgi:hypothetical protein
MPEDVQLSWMDYAGQSEEPYVLKAGHAVVIKAPSGNVYKAQPMEGGCYYVFLAMPVNSLLVDHYIGTR